MGRTCRILCLGVIAASLSLPAAAQAGSRPACATAGSKTRLATQYARMFSKPRTVRPSYTVTRWYGCLYSRDARFPLATVGEPGIFSTRVAQPRLNGAWAALADVYDGPAGGNYAQIRVFNLRTGKAFRNETAADGDEDTRTTDVPDLELTGGGSVAWIVQVRLVPSDVLSYRVFLHASNGARTLLDAGEDVDPGSLAVSGSWVYWTRGGLPRSAPLR